MATSFSVHEWKEPSCPLCGSPTCDFLIGQTCYAEYGILFGIDERQTHALPL